MTPSSRLVALSAVLALLTAPYGRCLFGGSEECCQEPASLVAPTTCCASRAMGRLPSPAVPDAPLPSAPVAGLSLPPQAKAAGHVRRARPAATASWALGGPPIVLRI